MSEQLQHQVRGHCMVVGFTAAYAIGVYHHRWRSVLLVEETGVPDKTIDQLQVTDKVYHIMLYRIYLAMSRMRTHSICGDRHRLHKQL
jgi:hypothetical protein